jgi:hypothetical protein
LLNQLSQIGIACDDDYKKIERENFIKMKNACLGNIAKQNKIQNEEKRAVG